MKFILIGPFVDFSGFDHIVSRMSSVGIDFGDSGSLVKLKIVFALFVRSAVDFLNFISWPLIVAFPLFVLAFGFCVSDAPPSLDLDAIAASFIRFSIFGLSF